MDSNDINDVSEKAEFEIKCAKKLLILPGDAFKIQKNKKTKNRQSLRRLFYDKSARNDETVSQSQVFFSKEAVKKMV